MPLNDKLILDTTKAFGTLSLLVFIASTWVALRYKAGLGKRIAGLLSIFSGLALMYYVLWAPIAD